MQNQLIIAIAGAHVLLLCGCGQAPQVQEYEIPGEVKRVVTSEALRSQFEIPFQWKTPAGWRPARNDQFSVVAWAAGPADESLEARVTLSELPASAGVSAQVSRWRNQIQLPDVSDGDATPGVETLKLGGATGSWVELTGDRETILGLLVEDEQALWVFKYRSANETAGKLRQSFREFCESVRIETRGKG